MEATVGLQISHPAAAEPGEQLAEAADAGGGHDREQLGAVWVKCSHNDFEFHAGIGQQFGDAGHAAAAGGSRRRAFLDVGDGARAPSAMAQQMDPFETPLHEQISASSGSNGQPTALRQLRSTRVGRDLPQAV
jgi:hypothetical protein